MRWLWLVIYLISLGIVYWLGYRARELDEEVPARKSNVPKDYLAGLTFLLNEETDKAVDFFIKMLEVDSETVETHLAIGKLFRKRGEVDRALRIHQNLIARPNLEKTHRETALFELAQDYLSAGLFDRAERIFLDLVEEKTHAVRALRSLIDIYQQEKSWEKALGATHQYQSLTKQNMGSVIAHFNCELAEIAIQTKQFEHAKNHLSLALKSDPTSVRSSLLYGKLSMQEGRYADAIKYFNQIEKQNPQYIPESIAMIAQCYEALNQSDQLLDYLKSLLDSYPYLSIALVMGERIRIIKGEAEAMRFIADYVRRHPSLQGLYQLVNFYMFTADGQIKEDLSILQKMIRKILAKKPDYQCKSCGFSGKSLHWQCPGCKQWDSILPKLSLDETLLSSIRG